MSGFLLDTNVFNRMVDAETDPAVIEGRGPLFVTHIQPDELQATRRKERANALLKVLTEINLERIPTAAAVWGVSKFGEAEFGDAQGMYGTMIQSLSARNKAKANNTQDILTAVTAHRRNLTLVTDDQDLATVMSEHGGNVISFDQFMKFIV